VAASSSGLLVPVLSAPWVTDSLRRPAAVAAHTPAMALPRLSPWVTPSIRRRGTEAVATTVSGMALSSRGEAVATGCVPGWAAAIADAAGMAVPLGGGSVSDRVRGWGTAGGTRVGGCEMAGGD
jgi:hypothetical protein